MNTFSHTVRWDWVKFEIESALSLTLKCLHRLSESPADAGVLGECIEPLIQASGALQFVELTIAARQSLETAKLLNFIKVDDNEISAELLEPILGSTLRLEAFIDSYRPNTASKEINLLPYLHDILALGRQSPITAHGFHLPVNLNAEGHSENLADEYYPSAESIGQTKKLRDLYRFNLLVLIRNLPAEQELSDKSLQSLDTIRKVFIQFSNNLDGSPSSDLFDIASALIEVLKGKRILLRTGVFALLKAVDTYITQLFKRDQSAYTIESYELLKNQILFYLIPCTDVSPETQRIRDQYSLGDLLTANPFLVEIVSPKSYLDKDTLQTSLTTFVDEICSTRLLLEQPSTSADVESAFSEDPLDQRFRRFSNIASILNYREWSERFSAAAVCEIDGNIDLLREFEADIFSRNTVDAEQKIVSSEHRFPADTIQITVSKILLDLGKVALCVEQYFSKQKEADKLEQATEILSSISTDFETIGFSKIVESINELIGYLKDWPVLENSGQNKDAQLPLVNFIVHLQFHLETGEFDFSPSQIELSDTTFFDSAIGCLQQLAQIHQPITPVDAEVSSESAAAEFQLPDADLIDDEILEIFSEEAEEVLEILQLHTPLWMSDQNSSSLAEIRRGFHTLKGSGRMVNAIQIADLAWSVENMLNRLIEGSISVSNDLLEIVHSVTEFLPTLTDAFSQRLFVDDARIEQWNSNAERISCGEPIEPNAVPESEALQLAETGQKTHTTIDTITPVTEQVDAELQESVAPVEAGVSPGSAAAEFQLPDADLIDDEILEIFSEEAEEVLEILQLHTPLWMSDQNSSSLAEIRRGFHTLKGSGRMVNAIQIADLAWSVENMLNRLLDGSISISNDLLEIVRSVTEFLPALTDAFSQRLFVDDARIDQWNSDAERISCGEPIEPNAASESETLQQSEATQETTDTIVPVTEPEPEPQDDERQEQQSEAETIEQPSLFEVFTQECTSHVQEISRYLSDPDATNESVSRALHTIKGSANAAESFNIARIAGALEPFFLTQDLPASECDPRLLELLDESVRLITGLLEQPSGQFEEQISGFFIQLDELHEANAADDPAQAEAATPFSIDLDIEDQPPVAIRDLLLEGMDCLSNCNHALEQWHLVGIDETERAELIGQCETLVSLASDAENSSVIEIATLLPKVFLALKPELTLDHETYLQIIVAQDALFNILDRVAMGQDEVSNDPVIKQLKELLESLQQLEVAVQEQEQIEPPVVETPNLSIVSDTDTETRDIFFEEARELSQSIEQAIESWFIEPDNAQLPQELLRHLHTLKGGARIIGIEQLASLSHDFESFLTKITPVSGDFDTVLRTTLLSWLAQLIECVDNLSDSSVSTGIDSPPVQIERRGPDRVQTRSPQPAEPAATLAPAIEPTPSQSTTKTSVQSAKKAAKSFTRVSTDLLESLVNLAGESSISRARTEQQVGGFSNTLEEMEITLERLRNQIRQIDIETQVQPKDRKSEDGEIFHEGFDPLEMDRYSGIQQLARTLMESTSDLIDLKGSLVDTARDAETTLLQQSRIHSELQAGLMQTRMVPFSKAVPRVRRVIRQTAEELNKPIQIVIKNAEVEVDRTILDRMVPALEHMLRNAVDHGLEAPGLRIQQGKPEAGTISLVISRDGGDMLIEVSDDGAGVDIDALRKKAIDQGLMNANDPLSDQEILQFILQSGVSTAESVTQISGRGVGLNVVNSEIKQLSGSIQIESTRGVGTRFIIRLPFTVSVTRALMTRTAGEQFAIPLNAIEGIVRVSPYELQNYYQSDAPDFEYAGQSYQVCYMGSLMDTKQTPNLQGLSAPIPVILARSGNSALAIQVDTIIGSHEIVVKPLGPQFIDVQGYSGATILGDGSVVIILDLSALIRGYHSNETSTQAQTSDPFQSDEMQVMVVDDSVTVRKVTSRLLSRNGMQVTLAKDGADAIEQLHDRIPDIILLDIEMPKMDGFEVARVIRHTDNWKHIPIIMISSRTGSKHREKAQSIGVNQFLGKPFQETDLLKNIKELTSSNQSPTAGDIIPQ